jgi:hypothetical protein
LSLCYFSDTFPCLGSDIARLFAFIRQKHDVAKAYDFMFSLAEEVLQDYNGFSNQRVTFEPVTIASCLTVYARVMGASSWTAKTFHTEALNVLNVPRLAFDKVNANALVYSFLQLVCSQTPPGTNDPGLWGYISNTTSWVVSKGLPVNSYTMNGLLNDDLELNQNLMMLIARYLILVVFL